MNRLSRIFEAKASSLWKRKMFRGNFRKSGCVSFTFDDFPMSAAQKGATILDKANVKGTFYTSVGLMGLKMYGVEMFSANQLRALIKNGHEIGCHTYSHFDFYQGGHCASGLNLELNQNLIELQKIVGPYSMQSFAFPKGRVTLAGKTILARKFESCRGVKYGINYPGDDLNQLKSVPLYASSFNAQQISKIVKDAVDNHGWLIFYTHDVGETVTSPFGCTIKQFELVLQIVINSGARILPVGEITKFNSSLSSK